jgi:hypothetical protein
MKSLSTRNSSSNLFTILPKGFKMDFRSKPDSVWTPILWVATFLIIIGGCFFGDTTFFLVGILVGALCGTVGSIFVYKTASLNNAIFSKQLMDEYGVTSSRSFYDIESDLLQSKDASTIFTQDGEDTPVFVKLVNRDGRRYKMAFTVLDANSLYPKPSE